MENNLVFKKADISDIDLLVKTRIEVLRAANKLPDDIDMSLVEKESYNYYSDALPNDEHVAYLVFENGQFAGCGGVSFYRVMPTYHNPSGKKAYIMNMYTRPKHRRKGIAFKTLDLLVQEAKSRKIDQISLESTEMGRPLYERYGFTVIKDEMEFVASKND
jgi:GNAT superfamily N-acetyltransferase